MNLSPRMYARATEVLGELYQRFGIPRDRLPYTPEVDRMRVHFYAQTHIYADPREFWELIVRVGKAGDLPVLDPSRTGPPKPTPLFDGVEEDE